MKTLGYYNGKYGELEEMSIPMNDRVCWFGDGVYDAGPSRNYKIFALDEHIDRFFNSAGLLDIEMPVTKEELKELLQEMVNKMDTGDLFVYYQVTRGTGVRDHAYTKGPGNLWIMLKPAEISDGIEPIKLITVEDTRFLHCNIKTLNLIPSCVATEKAKKAGCQEAVFYRAGGRAVSYTHLQSLVDIREDVVAVMIYDKDGKMMSSWSNGKTLKKDYYKNLSYVEPSDGELHISKPHVETLYEGFYPWVVTISQTCLLYTSRCV